MEDRKYNILILSYPLLGKVEKLGFGVKSLFLTINITATNKLNGKTWTTTHNTLAGTITNTSPMGRLVTLNYDPANLLPQNLTAPGLNQITYGYDEKGRRVSTTVGGRTTAIFYDGSGNIDHVTTPDNRTVRFTYDSLGRVKSETLPDNAVIGYDYIFDIRGT